MPPPTLDHVAIGVHRGADATPFLVGELGGEPYGAGPGGGFLFWQWRFEGGGVIEILEPDGPPGGFMHRFLASRGPGVHHVTFKVPDLRAAMARAGEFGYEVVGNDESFPGWKEAFLHPKQAQGVVVQLAEQDRALDPSTHAENWTFPPAPDPAAPVRVLGPRLSAQSADAAHRQWGELLEGGLEECDGALIYRWPDSALRVRIDIDPGAPEGPRAVELADDANVALPEGPHPVLGTAFTRGR